MRIPLHRGLHRGYNVVGAERVGQIEAAQTRMPLRGPEVALDNAALRRDWLKCAPWRRFLGENLAKMQLERTDCLELNIDFADLDALADRLWADAVGTAEEGGPADPPLMEPLT